MRDYGDGTIIPIKDSKFFYFSAPMGNSKRSPRFRCKNKAEGRKLFKQWLIESAEQAERKQIVTVGQHIRARWEVIRSNRRRTTQITHEQLLNNHIYKDEQFCSLNINNVKSQDVQDFILRINGSNSTKVRVYKFVRSFWTYLVLEGAIAKNPIYQAELPAVEESKIDAFTVEEQYKILDHVRGCPTWEALITYMLETGARQSEALGLRHQYVNYRTGKVEIAWALHAFGQETALQPPKSRAGYRVNKVSPTTLNLLLRQKNAQQNDSEYVWTDTSGKPWNRNALNKLWKRMLVRAGVNHRGMHALRHSACTRMIKAGIPATVIAKFVGHQKASLVTDTYASVFDDDLDAISVTNSNWFQNRYQQPDS